MSVYALLIKWPTLLYNQKNDKMKVKLNIINENANGIEN